MKLGFCLGVLGCVTGYVCWFYPEDIGEVLYNWSLRLNPNLADAHDIAAELIEDRINAVTERAQRQ